MKRVLTFLVIVATSTAIGFEPGLRVKYGVGPDPSAGEFYFYDIPITRANASAAGWACTKRPDGPLPQLVMYCSEDVVVCTLYDDTNYIAGLQVAVLKSDILENEFDWESRGFTSWITTVNGTATEFWTIQQYYVNEDYLAISKEKRLETRDESRMLQLGAVWVIGTNKNLLKVSNQEKDIIQERLFLAQKCTLGMGQHYYYNMSTTTECTYDQIYPWILMYKNGEMTATAFISFTKLKISRTRNWFERANRTGVMAFLPYAPECVYDLGDSPGSLTMHIYYVSEPWTITCPA